MLEVWFVASPNEGLLTAVAHIMPMSFIWFPRVPAERRDVVEEEWENHQFAM